MDINPAIFRAYDVRGVYGKDLTDRLMERIGSALSVFVGDEIVLGYDSRNSSPALRDAAMKGLTEAGVNVINIGLVPRGMVMFWCWKNNLPGVYITASHNPPEWNGVQFMYKNGQGFSKEDNMKVMNVVLEGKLSEVEQKGDVKELDVKDSYIEYLAERVPRPAKSMKVLLDCGNGTAGIVAQDIFNRMGIKSDVLFAEPDGNFPNRESDLTEESLKEAMSRAGNYDLVFAYDGDSDRLAMVDSRGRLANAETISYIMLKELLKKERGPVIANVECSKIIDSIVSDCHREVKRVPVGNSFMVQGINDNNACFGVETSRHFVVPSVVPFDDAIAVSLFAAYAISVAGEDFSDIIDKMPKFIRDRVNFECPDENKFRVVDRVKERLSGEYKKVNTMDGVRVDFDNSWVLIRVSNTTPIIRLTIEAGSREEYDKLKDMFSKVVKEELQVT